MIRDKILQRLEESAVELIKAMYGKGKEGLKKSKFALEDHKKNWQPIAPKEYNELKKHYSSDPKKKVETNSYMTKDGHKVERLSNDDKMPHLHKVVSLGGNSEHFIDHADYIKARNKLKKEQK